MPIGVNTIRWEPPNKIYPSAGFSPIPILEHQCINSGQMFVRAYIDSTDPITNLPTTVEAIKYEVISGEWPVGLTISNSGAIYGIVSDNRVTSPSKMGNPPLVTPYDQTNYLDYAKLGLNAVFTIRVRFASGSSYSAVFNMFVHTDWSSRRDDFILNIKNEYPLEKNPDLDIEYPKGKGFTFFLDGSPSSNEDYLVNMKSRGYFPGPGECSPFYKYTQMKPKPFKPLF